MISNDVGEEALLDDLLGSGTGNVFHDDGTFFRVDKVDYGQFIPDLYALAKHLTSYRMISILFYMHKFSYLSNSTCIEVSGQERHADKFSRNLCFKMAFYHNNR